MQRLLPKSPSRSRKSSLLRKSLLLKMHWRKVPPRMASSKLLWKLLSKVIPLQRLSRNRLLRKQLPRMKQLKISHQVLERALRSSRLVRRLPSLERRLKLRLILKLLKTRIKWLLTPSKLHLSHQTMHMAMIKLKLRNLLRRKRLDRSTTKNHLRRKPIKCLIKR